MKREYITFNIEKESYGIELKEAKEIIFPSKMTSVPNVPEYTMGVINLRRLISSRKDVDFNV